jgi:hypothetical protein
LHLGDAEGVVAEIRWDSGLYGSLHLGHEIAKQLGVSSRNIELNTLLLGEIGDGGTEEILHILKVFRPMNDGELASSALG